MQQTKKVLTQKDRLEEELLKIAPDVTPQDKKLLIDKHNISNATIQWYLNGRIMNNDTAITILTFLSKRIKARNAKIENL